MHTIMSLTESPEHKDGAQAARWALLGYGKDGSRPTANGLAGLGVVDKLKGVPEKGAELLHTLLNTCIGGGSGTGGWGRVCMESEEESGGHMGCSIWPVGQWWTN